MCVLETRVSAGSRFHSRGTVAPNAESQLAHGPCIDAYRNVIAATVLPSKCACMYAYTNTLNVMRLPIGSQCYHISKGVVWSYLLV